MSAWDAGARSIADFSGNGWFAFDVQASISGGAVVGLNDVDSGPSPADINHAFQITTGQWRIYENGAARSAYISFSGTQTFRVLRYDNVIYYMVGSTPSTHPDIPFALPAEVVYTTPATVFGTVFLDTSLFSPGDSVWDTVCTTTLPGLAIDLIMEYMTTGGTSTAPTVNDYVAAGIVGITESNLAAMNAAVAASMWP